MKRSTKHPLNIEQKREMLHAVTLSVEEVSSLSGISTSGLKQMCRGEHKKLTFKPIEFKDFKFKDLDKYEKKGLDMVIEHRGHSSLTYRIFFHTLDKLLKEKEYLKEFIEYEEQKLDFRKHELQKLIKKNKF